MTYFYKKDGEIFIPEQINPDLVKMAYAIIKACKITFKLQLKVTSVGNALKNGKREQMLEIMQKCFAKNKKLYDSDMALTGVTVEEIDPSFFEDKDAEFIKAQLKILYDFAIINTVVESKMMGLLAAACEKTLNTPLNKIKFFTNQQEILEQEDDQEAQQEETENE